MKVLSFLFSVTFRTYELTYRQKFGKTLSLILICVQLKVDYGNFQTELFYDWILRNERKRTANLSKRNLH